MRSEKGHALELLATVMICVVLTRKITNYRRIVIEMRSLTGGRVRVQHQRLTSADEVMITSMCRLNKQLIISNGN